MDDRPFTVNFGSPGSVASNFQTILVFIVIIALIVLILLIFYFLYRGTQKIPLQHPVIRGTQTTGTQNNIAAADVNRGASSDGFVSGSNGIFYQDEVSCNLSPTRQWMITRGYARCTCIPGWFGPKCDEEAYSNEYMAVGNITSAHPSIGRQDIMVDSISFGKNGCTQQCNSTDECTGIVYSSSGMLGTTGGHNVQGTPDTNNPSTQVTTGITGSYNVQDTTNNSSIQSNRECSLLLGDISVTGRIGSPDPSTGDTLYVKRNKRAKLIFPDRIVLYKGTLPSGWWLQERANGSNGMMATVYPGQVFSLDFRPENYIGTLYNSIPSGNLSFSSSTHISTGIYSNKPFTVDDVARGTLPQAIYIHYPRAPLNLPSEWKNVYAYYT